MNYYTKFVTLLYLARLIIPAYLGSQYDSGEMRINCDHEPLLRLYLGLSALSFVTVYQKPAILSYQFQLLIIAGYSYFAAECNNTTAWKYLKGDFLFGLLLFLGTGLKLLCRRKPTGDTSQTPNPVAEPSVVGANSYGGIYLVQEA